MKKLFRVFMIYFLFDWLIGGAAGGFFMLETAQGFGQENYVRDCSTRPACTLAVGVSWSAPAQTYVFSPMSPDISIRIWVHNNNTTSAHTAQTVTAWITSSLTVGSLINQADFWVQAAITDNSTTNAKCTAVAANSPTAAPGANGMGTCYITGMYAAQIAIQITPGGSQAGSPDTFDIGIVQCSQSHCNYPSGPQPGTDTSTGGDTTLTTYADATTNAQQTPSTGNTTLTYPAFSLGFNGTTWDRIRAGRNADAQTPTGYLNMLPYVFNGATWDRWRGITVTPLLADGDAQSNSSTAQVQTSTGAGSSPLAVYDHGFNGASWDRIRAGVTADAQTPTGFLNSIGYGFNGTTWDRIRTSGNYATSSQTATGSLLNRPKEMATYSISGNGAPVATPSDVDEVCGNGTTTVQILRWEISFSATAAPAANIVLQWIRRSTTDTGSTPVNFVVTPSDTSDAANSTTPRGFTVTNPATGTQVGIIKQYFVTPDNVLSNSDPQIVYTYTPEPGSKPWTLRGATQCIYVNLGGATLPAGFTLATTVVWVERTDI